MKSPVSLNHPLQLSAVCVLYLFWCVCLCAYVYVHICVLMGAAGVRCLVTHTDTHTDKHRQGHAEDQYSWRVMDVESPPLRKTFHHSSLSSVRPSLKILSGLLFRSLLIVLRRTPLSYYSRLFLLHCSAETGQAPVNTKTHCSIFSYCLVVITPLTFSYRVLLWVCVLTLSISSGGEELTA
jgi:hypothetical protein